ncbi:MAG: HipA domain-containing protein [Microbacteriaceae bacterium]|nr:HipA domain-containing protein [Microbacteriaceae bacterium]
MVIKNLENYRFVKQADVYKNGTLAGQLTRLDGGEIEFRYLADYDGKAVASTLPLDANHTPSHGLPPFFAGLLPEGHRLTQLQRAIKTSADDELSLLLAVGQDAPGDVQIVETGKKPQEPVPLVARDISELDFRDFDERIDSHAIPGVQRKASATMMNVPLNIGRIPAILKLDPPEHQHLVLNENLHLQNAQNLKIPVAEGKLVHDAKDRPGLLVRRFDRVVSDDGEITRLAMEDGAQALGILPAQKYAVDAAEVVLALARLTDAPMVAVRNMYLQFAFAYLTGNGDLHAKNLAVVTGSDGKTVVAPVYDIPCTALYRDLSMALPLNGKLKKLKLSDWDAFAESIGLPLRAARAANKLALKAAAGIDLSELPFAGSVLNGAVRELKFRRDAITE